MKVPVDVVADLPARRRHPLRETAYIHLGAVSLALDTASLTALAIWLRT
ncbi:hypothetical protein [Streptomyces sp. NBC_00370]